MRITWTVQFIVVMSCHHALPGLPLNFGGVVMSSLQFEFAYFFSYAQYYSVNFGKYYVVEGGKNCRWSKSLVKVCIFYNQKMHVYLIYH